MGALGFTGFNALFYLAGHYTSAVNLALIQAVIPALVLVGSSVFFRMHESSFAWIGAVVTIAGVAVITAHGDWAIFAHEKLNFGDAMMLIACVFYAFYTLGLRKRPPSPVRLSRSDGVAALVTSIPLFVVEILARRLRSADLEGGLLLPMPRWFPRLIAQMLYMRGVELIGPGRAGVFVNLVPVFGALLAVALLGEPFAAYHVVALALVVAGIRSRNGATSIGRRSRDRHQRSKQESEWANGSS